MAMDVCKLTLPFEVVEPLADLVALVFFGALVEDFWLLRLLGAFDGAILILG